MKKETISEFVKIIMQFGAIIFSYLYYYNNYIVPRIEVSYFYQGMFLIGICLVLVFIELLFDNYVMKKVEEQQLIV